MKNILCFGDSNTYGFKPDGSGRYDFHIRYPGKLQLILGDKYHVIEEGCPGRTTIFEDCNRPHIKGLDYIVPCICSHTPLDYVIIMLGTNDCKSAYSASAKDIAEGLSQLIVNVKKYLDLSAKIIIVSPIHLGERVWEDDFDIEFDENSVVVSKNLALEYKKISKKYNCIFFDASTVASASPIDQVHLDAEGHASLATALAKLI